MTQRTYTCIGCNEPKTTDKRKGPIPHRCPECKQTDAIARAKAAYALKKQSRSAHVESETLMPPV